MYNFWIIEEKSVLENNKTGSLNSEGLNFLVFIIIFL